MNSQSGNIFETISGKFFLAAIYGLILYLSTGKNYFIAPGLIFFCSIFYSKRTYILAAATVFGWFFLDSLFHFVRLNFRESHVNLFSIILRKNFILTDHNFIYTKIATLIIVFILIGILYAYSFFQKKINPTMYLSIITFSAVGATIFFDEQGWLAVCALTLTCCLMKFIWFMAFHLTDMRSRKNHLLSSILSIEPIWIFNFHRVHAVPRGSAEIFSSEQMNVVALSKCQISGIKLAIASMFFKLSSEFLEKLIFNGQGSSIIFNYINLYSLNLPNPNLIGLAKYNLLDISLFQMWSVVLIKPVIYFLFEPIGNAGLLVAFLRLLGFRIHRNFYRPDRATTFSNFLHRIYFYYSHVLIHLIYIPMYSFLSKFISRSKLKVFLGTFLTIFLGGFIMSYFRNNLQFIEFGALSFFNLILLKMPYLFIIAALAALSNVFSFTCIQKHQYLKVAFFYIAYSIAFGLQGHLQIDSFDDIIGFFMKLTMLAEYGG